MNEKKQRSTEALPKPRRTFYTLVGKRLLDIFLSGFAIILLSPLLLFPYWSSSSTEDPSCSLRNGRASRASPSACINSVP